MAPKVCLGPSAKALFRCLARYGLGFAASRRRIELQELFRLQIFFHLEEGGQIPASITVVGSTKNGHDGRLVTPIVPFHDELMGPGHHLESVAGVKGGGNVRAKGKAGAAGGNAPPGAIVGIAPQQITHGSFVGYFLHPIELTNVIEGINRRTESAVQTKNGRFHHGREGEIIKEIGK
eukprot:scaffold482_cov266-Amphora_coffeaeformis.AAC.40